jgi:hypothetical protein
VYTAAKSYKRMLSCWHASRGSWQLTASSVQTFCCSICQPRQAAAAMFASHVPAGPPLSPSYVVDGEELVSYRHTKNFRHRQDAATPNLRSSTKRSHVRFHVARLQTVSYQPHQRCSPHDCYDSPNVWAELANHSVAWGLHVIVAMVAQDRSQSPPHTRLT